MAGPKKKYKRVSDVPSRTVTVPKGQARRDTWVLHTPDNKRHTFYSAEDAQRYVDLYYPNYSLEEAGGTPGGLGNTTPKETSQLALPEAPKTLPHFASEDLPVYIPSEGSTPFERMMNVKIANNRLGNLAYRRALDNLGMNPLKWPERGGLLAGGRNESYWDSDIHKAVRKGNNIAAGIIAAPFVLKTLGAAYSVPEIAGALNLYGAYEGLGRLTSDEGVKKTWNHIQNGEWWDATKSAGGDVLDVAMSLPFLNRVRLGSKWLYNGAKGEVVNLAINRSSPNYSSTFNWETGRFNLTPKPGVNVPEGTSVKFGPTLGLPSPTLSLPGSVSLQPVRTLSLGAGEAPTYGSMNEVADALEAGILPTNEEIAAASRVTRPPRFYGGEEISSIPTSVNGQPIPPAVLPDGSMNAAYYQALANHFNRVVESPNGYAIFPSVEEGLPRPPREVNNVADSGRNVVEDFDWSPYEVETPSPSTPPAQLSLFNDIFNNAGFSRDPGTGYYSDAWGENLFLINDNGTLHYRPSQYSTVGTSLLQSELEPFLQSLSSGTPFISGNYLGLDDFMIRAGYYNRGGRRLGASFGNLWEFDYRHPTGSTIPVRVRDTGTVEAPGTLRIRAHGLPPMDISSKGLSREGLYNTIDTYLSNILGRELTPELTALIQSQFPIQSTYPNGRISFRLNNSADSPALQYNPLTGHVRISGRGYNQWDGDITNLTLEMLLPKRIPEIIPSSDLPLFSAISRGTDWGLILGVGGNYNSQINFGLERSRPTFDQVVNTLGGVRIESPSNFNANMTVYELGRLPSNDFPYLDLPNSIPIIHTNLVPKGREATLDWSSKKWAGARIADLVQSAKGVDIASTEMVNPTLSRVVSDISAALNLSNLDKYNLLHEVITRPELYFPSGGNFGDYSLFSYPENAVKGNSQRKFFTEPSLNFRTDDFNGIGLREGSAAAEGPARSFIDFLNANGFKGNLLDINDLQLIFEWLLKNAPLFYLTIDNKTFIPFPITTVKKKGGRLVKKKFNLNGKKTYK